MRRCALALLLLAAACSRTAEVPMPLSVAATCWAVPSGNGLRISIGPFAFGSLDEKFGKN